MSKSKIEFGVDLIMVDNSKLDCLASLSTVQLQ